MAKPEISARQKTFRENLQLIYDGMKHLTTLSTASIVIITTFLEKIFSDPAPASTRLVVWAIAFLLASIFCSIFTMYGISKTMMELSSDGKNFNYFYLATIICFAVGIIMLALFAGINLWTE